MSIGSMLDLYINQLRDVYAAGERLTRSLPGADAEDLSDQLRGAIIDHLEQMRGHVDRLDGIFTALEQLPTARSREDAYAPGATGNADDGHEGALLAAAQRMDHCEIAAYGTLCAVERLLGRRAESQPLPGSPPEEEANETWPAIAGRLASRRAVA
jgi:ferritin-like metal-binding protein YciE